MAGYTSSKQDVPIDPEILKDSEDLCNLANDTTALERAMEETRFEDIHRSTSFEKELLSMAPLDFVKKFSTYNVIRNEALFQAKLMPTEAKRNAYGGNSKDEVTLFQIPCPNAQFGCCFKSPYPSSIRGHQIVCKVVSDEAATDLRLANDSKGFICLHEGCSSRFTKQYDLDLHVQEYHEWRPRACLKEDCTDTTIFQTKSLLRRHTRNCHNSFEGTTCLFPGCKSTTVFKVKDNYRRHLRSTHKLPPGAERDEYFPKTVYKRAKRAKTSAT